MRESTRAPRKYELMTILHPEVEEESLPGELDRIQSYITAIGGELIESLRESPWGRRRLAYPIRSGGKDVRDGYYTVWHFTAAPNQLLEMERELKLNTQLIRYIILSWEPKPLDPKEIEAAEIAAEEAAAAAYAAAQAAEVAADSEAADAYAAAQAAEQAAAEAAATAEAEATATAIAEADADADADADTDAAIETEQPMGLVAQAEEAEALTAEAEAVEATGAELAVEAVAAVEAREELEEEAAAAVAKAEAAAEADVEAEAEAAADESDVPDNAIRGTESGECPEDYPVKGNASSKLYHTPGSPSYNRTIPEFCFASVEAAEAAGFGPTKYEAAQEQEQEAKASE